MSSYKLVIAGSVSCGKTALAIRATEGTFNDDSVATIGVEYFKKEVTVGGKVLKLQLFDTAGSERFKAISRTLYTGARGVFLVYDITRKKSFEEIPSWFSDVKQRIPADTPVFLVGNKCDLEGQREVSRDEGDRHAREHGMFFIETSAKDSTNVEKAFEWLGTKILEVEEAREAKQAAAAAATAAGGAASAARVSAPQDEAAPKKVDLSKPQNGPGAATGKSGGGGGCKC